MAAKHREVYQSTARIFSRLLRNGFIPITDIFYRELISTDDDHEWKAV